VPESKGDNVTEVSEPEPESEPESEPVPEDEEDDEELLSSLLAQPSRTKLIIPSMEIK
jgi:hypothetical protein